MNGEHSAEKDRLCLPEGPPTIYGDYVAPAVLRTGGGSWHVESDEQSVTLCGKTLTGTLRRMDLHVSLLECSRCMALGGAR